MRPASLPQICLLFHKSVGFSENLRVLVPKLPLGDGGGDGLGRHLVPPFLAVNSSSFRLVLLNYKRSVFFLDVSCPS